MELFSETDFDFNLFDEHSYINPVDLMSNNEFSDQLMMNTNSPQQTVPSNSRENSPGPHSPGDATLPILKYEEENLDNLMDSCHSIHNPFIANSFVHTNPFEPIKIKEEINESDLEFNTTVSKNISCHENNEIKNEKTDSENVNEKKKEKRTRRRYPNTSVKLEQNGGKKRSYSEMVKTPDSISDLTREDLLKMSSSSLDKIANTIAQQRPLSAEEERQLKRQRRLIKNRESAQLSRQRKKKYIEDLETKVTQLSREKRNTLKI
eukprot:TRINITY_DN3981_c0_g1_i2.p1 TRINITY_DN3981_c0_g1~~TRINITY_DN3981_c0_g1_i2.p1  ORF type:complete len:264 (+),score=71.39 TRINITY_DN3981_c0_g1_i2:162-953(+)